jgi:hypothetical protein
MNSIKTNKNINGFNQFYCFVQPLHISLALTIIMWFANKFNG